MHVDHGGVDAGMPGHALGFVHRCAALDGLADGRVPQAVSGLALQVGDACQVQVRLHNSPNRTQPQPLIRISV